MNEWPILKHPLGYVLIEFDFTHPYEDTNQAAVFANWDTFFNHIRNFRGVNPALNKDKNATNLLELLNQETLPNGEKNSLFSRLIFL